MKPIIKHIIGIVGTVVLAGSLASCEQHDYPDRFRATEGLQLRPLLVFLAA